MWYRVARKRADLLRMSLVTTAATLAICLLALVETTNKAEAEDSLPENGKIAFHRVQNNEKIYTVEPDGSNLRLLIPGSGGAPKWSPDGTKIVVEWGADIATMSADGSNLRNVTNASGGSAPTWSADGTSVAFSFHQGGNIDYDIFMVDLDNSNKTTLGRTPELYESNPDFSPDGSQICFAHFESGVPGRNPSGIYVRDVHRSDPTLLFEDDTPGTCDWSPDGKKIVFNTHSDWWEKKSSRKAEVYIINADGSGLTALTSNSAGDLSPAWSPDGTKIVFSSDRDGGDYDIYAMDADGSEVARVINLPRDEFDPDWQPLLGTTVHQPDTGGPSLLLVASVLLISGGVTFYAGLKRRM